MKQILMIFYALTSIFISKAFANETITPEHFPKGVFEFLKKTDTARINAVIDPSTIQLKDGRLIHLAGIDTPDWDIHQPGDFSLVATKILQDMLHGQSVNLYQTPKKDWGRTNRMGQHIAHLQRTNDGAWVQGTLIELGLARVRTTQRTPEMSAQMYILESKARAKKSGIWHEEAFQVLSPETAPKHIEKFQIVKGQIQSVALKKNRIYLNFGKDWRNDFTVSVAPKDKKRFSKAGMDLMSLNGQHIRVRGWLEDYNGPYIEINHPQALEVLDTPPS